MPTLPRNKRFSAITEYKVSEITKRQLVYLQQLSSGKNLCCKKSTNSVRLYLLLNSIISAYY